MNPEFLTLLRRLLVPLLRALDKELLRLNLISMTYDEKTVYDWILTFPETKHNIQFQQLKIQCKSLGRLPIVKE